VLPIAQDLALAAEPEVELGKVEAIGRGLERGEATARRGAPLGRALQKDRTGGSRLCPRARAADEASRGQAIGVEDEHDRGIWHVDAHLDHGRGDEHVRLAGAKAVHGTVLVGGGHAAREDVARDASQGVRGEVGGRGRNRVHARRGAHGLRDVIEVRPIVGVIHERTDDICLVPASTASRMAP